MKKTILAVTVAATFASANAVADTKSALEASQNKQIHANRVMTHNAHKKADANFGDILANQKNIATNGSDIELNTARIDDNFKATASAVNSLSGIVADNNVAIEVTNHRLEHVASLTNSSMKSLDTVKDDLTIAKMDIMSASEQAGENSASIRSIDSTISLMSSESQETYEMAEKNTAGIVATNARITANQEGVNALVDIVVDNHDGIAANKQMIEDATNYVISEREAAVDIINGQNEVQQHQLDNHEERITKTETAVFGEVEKVRGYARSADEKADENKNKITKNAEAVALVEKNVATNSTGIATNSRRINDNSARIDQNSKDIMNLRSDFERQSEITSAGIAGVAAMANIPHMQQAGQFSVGAGVGYFDNQSAVAIGVGYRYSENITTQVGISANTGNDIKPVVGAGVAFAF